MRRLISVITAATLLTGLLTVTPAAAASGGLNDWSCRPSEAHPDPVVLVHGTWDNKDTTWRVLGPLLVEQGYCAFALTYGVDPNAPAGGEVVGGLMPMDYSAKELQAFVESVLSATGKSKVDIVGFSQGTWLPTYYAKLLGGAGKINRYVSLAPGWAGTNLLGLSYVVGLLNGIGLGVLHLGDLVGHLVTNCAVCPEMLAGSATLRKLQEGGVFLPNITYTNIVSQYDGLVVPYTSGIGQGPNVTNVVLQQFCPDDHVNHAGVPIDPNAIGHVLNALDPANAKPVACVAVEPVLAG